MNFADPARDLPSLAAAIAQLGTSLRRLSLATNPISDLGAIAIAKADLRLEKLDLSRTDIRELGARALAESPWGDSLQSLDLRGNHVGKGAARAALRTRFGRRVQL